MRLLIGIGGEEATLGVSYPQDSPDGALLHSIDGWYDRSVDITTENKIFSGGDVITKITHKGKEITVNLSVRIPDDDSPMGMDQVRGFDLIGVPLDYIKIRFGQEDKDRLTGEWESYAEPVMTSHQINTISKRHFTVDLVFYIPSADALDSGVEQSSSSSSNFTPVLLDGVSLSPSAWDTEGYRVVAP